MAAVSAVGTDTTFAAEDAIESSALLISVSHEPASSGREVIAITTPSTSKRVTCTDSEIIQQMSQTAAPACFPEQLS
jgi:hypothetical protein